MAQRGKPAIKEEHSIQIPAGDVILEGNLYYPLKTGALVVFAHGSGSGRQSPRNQLCG